MEEIEELLELAGMTEEDLPEEETEANRFLAEIDLAIDDIKMQLDHEKDGLTNRRLHNPAWVGQARYSMKCLKAKKKLITIARKAMQAERASAMETRRAQMLADKRAILEANEGTHFEAQLMALRVYLKGKDDDLRSEIFAVLDKAYADFYQLPVQDAAA